MISILLSSCCNIVVPKSKITKQSCLFIGMILLILYSMRVETIYFRNLRSSLIESALNVINDESNNHNDDYYNKDNNYFGIDDLRNETYSTTTKTNSRIDNNHNNNHVHVLYGLSGNEPGVLHEFEVSLKSVLLNAPIHSDLTIHIMADYDSYNNIHLVFQNAFYFTNISYDEDSITYSEYTTTNDNNTDTIGDNDDVTNNNVTTNDQVGDDTTNTTQYEPTILSSWRTLNQITIQTYNVESYLDQWYGYIETQMNHSVYDSIKIHTIGTFFRLFAHDILDSKIVPYVIYLDTDVVIMAKLDHIWQYTINNNNNRITTDVNIENNNNMNNNNINNNINPNDIIFQWGVDECAGFMLLNIERLNLLWELVSTINLHNISLLLHQNYNDQLVFRSIQYTYPNLVSTISNQWDVSIASLSKLWRPNINLITSRPNGIGILHFNGGGPDKTSAFLTSDFITKDKFKYTWGHANYYVTLPWQWTKFILKSSCIHKNIVDTTTTNHIRTNNNNEIHHDHDVGYPIIIKHNHVFEW